VEPGSSAVGGGAFPATTLPTFLVLLDAAIPAQQLDARLRAGAQPVVARVVQDRVAIDQRPVAEPAEAAHLDAVLDAARA
jgi:hypothetical protein